MNKREMKKFQKLLHAERTKLSEGIRKLEEETLFQPPGEHGADLANFAEVGTDNFERETALNIASGESERLHAISEALMRIEQGTYGTCGGCQNDIPTKRLEVFPSARYCIECQSKLEKEGSL